MGIKMENAVQCIVMHIGAQNYNVTYTDGEAGNDLPGKGFGASW